MLDNQSVGTAALNEEDFEKELANEANGNGVKKPNRSKRPKMEVALL